MQLRIAGTADDSIVDGEGIRYTVFVQGCPRRCAGCQNPETQSYTGGRLTTTEAILAEFSQNPLLSGITFSGGEPFTQPAPLARLAKAVHAHSQDVWCYTGYTLEELQAMRNPAVNDLLANIDVLIDGEFIYEQRDLTLKFRGSRNQRVIDMPATRDKGRVVLKKLD